jgi:hypothetical protein
MRVSEAVNPIDPVYVWTMFGALLVVYAVIAYFFLTILLRLSARWRLDEEGRRGQVEGEEEEVLAPEEAVPYGPRSA